MPKQSPANLPAKPLISVVMPAYNHERFIAETIDSVLKQSYPNIELIIIDDGSTDGTAGIVKAYTDHRLHYFYQENQDAYNALNNGITKALENPDCEFIAIINSDDVYTLDRFERLIPHFNDNNTACVFSDVSPIDDDSQPLDDPEFGWNQWHQNNRNFYLEAPDDLYRGFLHGNFMVTTSNLLMRASAAKKVGGFAPLRYLHDYDFIFRMMLAHPGGVKYIHDQILMRYRIHGGNTLSEAAITGREQDQQVIRQYLLANCPEAHHAHIETALDRLVALEQELAEVRTQLVAADAPPAQTPSATPDQAVKAIPSRVLLTTLLNRLAAKLTRRG